MSDKVDRAIEVVNKGIDVFQKLCATFRISKETKELMRKNQEEINQLKFKKFKETSSCNGTKGIAVTGFKNFVENLQKRCGLPDKVKDSILDALNSSENEESVTQFQFKDGQGDVHHGRFLTIKRDNMIDIAYAIYSLSFELLEREIERRSCYWLFNIPIPLGDVVITKEPQCLSVEEMDKFAKWCLVKLYDRVQEERGSQLDKAGLK